MTSTQRARHPGRIVALAPFPRRWSRADFERPTLRVARDLLGQFIVHQVDGVCLAAMIAETEAYKGPRDRAAHTAGGRRTRRVEPLYGAGGTAYVYFVYGMHWMLNFSSVGEGVPEGVLIRAIVAGAPSQPLMLSGPGRVTRHLAIDGELHGLDTTVSRVLWVEDRGVRIAARHVIKGPRVGVDYAGVYWAARPWRFRIEAAAARAAMSSAGEA